MANWLCCSETLIFTQLTKSLWRWRVLHGLCWVRQTSRLTGRQMHSFWKQSAFFLSFFFFFLSYKYSVRPLPITSQSLELVSNLWTCIWTSSVPWSSVLCVSVMNTLQDVVLGGSRTAEKQTVGILTLVLGEKQLNGRTFQERVW